MRSLANAAFPFRHGAREELVDGGAVSSYCRADLYRVTRLEVELERLDPAEREDPYNKVQDPDEPGEGVQEERERRRRARFERFAGGHGFVWLGGAYDDG